MIGKLNEVDTDERAVSPVIGVILMVAITVILAAVIGTFVLGLGGQVSDTAPQASVSMADASDDITNANANITDVEHTGGETLNMDNVNVIVRNQSDNSIVFDNSTYDDSTESSKLYINGDEGGTEFSTGDVMKLNDNESVVNDAGRYKVILIHEPSGQQIASSVVDVE